MHDWVYNEDNQQKSTVPIPMLAVFLLIACFLGLTSGDSGFRCPEHYNLIGDRCVKYVLQKSSHSMAVVNCQNDYAHLASIHSAEENRELLNAAPMPANYWIGLGCDRSDEFLHWDDFSPFNYNNIDPEEWIGCMDHSGYELATNGQWRAVDKNITMYSICMVPGESTLCPHGYTNLFGHKCVRIDLAEYEFGEARDECHVDGAELASIHSVEENNALKEALPDELYPNFWIGMKCDSSGNKYWVDGTPIDFLNNSPNDNRCTDLTAYFMNISGWFQQDLFYDLGMICMRDVIGYTTRSPSDPTLPPTTPTPHLERTVCSEGYEFLEQQQSCLKVVKSILQSPMMAEETCENEGGHLASIHSKQENDFIRRLALSNKIVDAVVVGIRTNLSEHYQGWTDGTPFDYQNYGDGMPEEQIGYCGGMLLRDTSGPWFSVDCYAWDSLAYACTKAPVCAQPVAIKADSGEVNSPADSDSSLRGLICEYDVTVNYGRRVTFQLTANRLLPGDTITFYEGDRSTPLSTVTDRTGTTTVATTNSNDLRIVYSTGHIEGIRSWQGNFHSV